MNILNIALKEIKKDCRDIRTFVFMLAFPIVLMLILGTALTNTFNTQVTLEKIDVLYQNTAADASLAGAWGAFVQAAGENGVHFEKAASGMDGKQAVQSGDYTGYAEIGASGIRYYGSGSQAVESNIVQGMLTGFTNRYNLAVEVAKVDPQQVQSVLKGGGQDDYIRETSLNAAKQPGSLDYYAVAMTTMIALYGALSASFLIRGERIRNTSIRLLAAPVSKVEIFIGKIAGNVVINAVCLAVVVLFSKWVFKADWGDHFAIVAAVLLTEVVLAVALGVVASYLFKGDASRAVLMIVIQLASFIGGAYFQIGDTSGIMSVVTNLSPLRWANTALFRIIYEHQFAAALPAIALNVGIAGLFLIIAVVSMQRREGM